jgi:hypothetical protein
MAGRSDVTLDSSVLFHRCGAACDCGRRVALIFAEPFNGDEGDTQLAPWNCPMCDRLNHAVCCPGTLIAADLAD